MNRIKQILQENPVVAAPMAGIRVALCALPEEKIVGMAEKIRVARTAVEE